MTAAVSWRDQLFATRSSAHAYRQSLENRKDVHGMLTRLVQLCVYPWKSVGGPLVLPEAVITHAGIATAAQDASQRFHDRGAMLGRKMKMRDKPHISHVLFSQRNWGKLCLPAVFLSYGDLCYEDPTGKCKGLRLTPEDFKPKHSATTVVMMHGNELRCVVEGNGKMTRWIRDFMKTHDSPYNPEEVDVLLPPIDYCRQHHCQGLSGKTLYVDEGQIFLASTGTLHWMNHMRRQVKLRTVQMPAFRPNLVVNLPPNAEDLIDQLIIHTAQGNVDVKAGLLGVRCKMIDIDPLTGESPDDTVQAWLRKHRAQNPSDADKTDTTTFGLDMLLPQSADGVILQPGMNCTVSEKGR